MSFKLKLKSLNLDCAPMITEGFNGKSNIIGYMCKNNRSRNIEGFQNVQAYDNVNITYQVDDVVSYQGSIFRMREGAGRPGYAPDRVDDKLWELVSGPGNAVHRPKGKTINIVEASYGVNCNNNLRGNRTDFFRGLTAGKSSLDYRYDYTKTGGDPAVGCGKTLEVKFHCGDNNIQTLVVPPEAGYNGVVKIDCSSKNENEQAVKVKEQPVVNAVKSMSSRDSSGLVKYVRLGGGDNWINLSQLVVTDSNGNNVSRGRATTSSGVGAGGEEGNAVDGDEQPRHHPRGYHSSSDKNPFFQVTLDNPTNVASVTVYGRNDFGSRMVGHKISLLDSDKNVIFTSNSLNSELKQTINIPGINAVARRDEPVVANSRSQSQPQNDGSGLVKYVKLSGGNDWINLSQLVVKDSDGNNAARGAITSSSGVAFGGDESKAVDGVEQARDHPQGYHSNSDKNAFFQVELPKPTNVKSVTVYNRKDCCSGRMASGHKIQLLDSNKNVLFTSNNLIDAPQQTINITGSVKYVKLGGGNDWINLSQLVVTDSNGVNIAKGRPTTSSGVGYDGNESNAVDGVEQARDHPREYHSSADRNAFFQVELDNPSNVSSVTVYNRKDCCSNRMASGHKIYLLDSNKKVLFESNNLNGELKQTINISKDNLRESFSGINGNDISYCAFGKVDYDSFY
jgi:hypothetical protein